MRVCVLIGALIAPMVVSSAASGESIRPIVIGKWKKQVHGRESSLPLCTWGNSDRSMALFTMEQASPWTCRAPGVPGDDTCSWSGYRPTDAQYFVVPRDQASNYTDELPWPDGSTLYSTWTVRCAASDDGSSQDIVLSTVVDGQPLPGSTCGPLSTGPHEFDVVVVDVDGGVLEHIRPGLVRGTVQIKLGRPQHMRRVENDLTLAIQVLGDEGWYDFATTTVTTEYDLRTFEVQTTVPELSDVRLQVRGMERCDQHIGVGYDLRAARIFVETCVPDQSNPGQCL